MRRNQLEFTHGRFFRLFNLGRERAVVRSIHIPKADEPVDMGCEDKTPARKASNQVDTSSLTRSGELAIASNKNIFISQAHLYRMASNAGMPKAVDSEQGFTHKWG